MFGLKIIKRKKLAEMQAKVDKLSLLMKPEISEYHEIRKLFAIRKEQIQVLNNRIKSIESTYGWLKATNGRTVGDYKKAKRKKS